MSSFEKMSVSSSFSIKEEKYNMKQFILATQDYIKTKCKETASLLSRYLQLLGVADDLYTFDPHNSVTVQFFISLHELMSNLDDMSNLTWCSIYVLQQACKNTSTRKALIHTYQFLPILSKILSDSLPREKKIKLLTLMQELTHGVKILWQVSHITHLIQILTKWIESGDEQIAALSLGVLLNLCYKNFPVICTLMRLVNTKHFIRTVIATKTPATEIQVCKLLMVLEYVNDDIPDDVIVNFIEVTFKTIIEALQVKDLVRLRHIVDFFMDMKNQRNQSCALNNFNYHSEVTRILEDVENDDNKDTNSAERKDQRSKIECIELLIEFITTLVELKIPDINTLNPKIIDLALNWLQNEPVCLKALVLLKSIIFHCPNNMSTDISQKLLLRLPLFIELILTSTFNEHSRKLCALLQLLRALVCCREVRNSVIEHINDEAMRDKLTLMLKNEEILKYNENNDGIELCMSALALVGQLSQEDTNWDVTYQHIIKQRQMHILLAKASIGDSQEVKVLLFDIIQLHKFPKHEVAQAMCDLQPTFELKLNQSQNSILKSNGFSLVTSSQARDIDTIIQTFKDTISNNKLTNAPISEIMELYEYKMASVVQMEKAYQNSLDYANQLMTYLQHKDAQTSTELSKLHQLLFSTQQYNEIFQKQINEANESIKKLSARLKKEEITNKELSGKIKVKEEELIQKTITITTLENKQEEQLHAIKTLSKKYESQCEKNLVLVSEAERLDNFTNQLQIKINENQEDINKNNSKIEKMTTEIKHLEELRKLNESTILSKDKELQEALQNLAMRQKLIETITKLTTSNVV